MHPTLSLRPANDGDLADLISWFPDQLSLSRWGGPGLVFGQQPEQFGRSIGLSELSSWSMIDSSEAMLAFGQYYPRLSRIHLGRLAVTPARRGQGLAKDLITALLLEGYRELSCSQGSLFVYPDNLIAIKAYEGLGFEFAEYPDVIPGNLENCRYMIHPDITELMR